jgi:hypothetical protein
MVVDGLRPGFTRRRRSNGAKYEVCPNFCFPERFLAGKLGAGAGRVDIDRTVAGRDTPPVRLKDASSSFPIRRAAM